MPTDLLCVCVCVQVALSESKPNVCYGQLSLAFNPPEPSCACVSLHWLESIDMFNRRTRSSDRRSLPLVWTEEPLKQARTAAEKEKAAREAWQQVCCALLGKAENKITVLQNTARETMPQFAALETALVIAIGLALTDAMLVLRGPTVATGAVTLFVDKLIQQFDDFDQVN